ncbi:MAG: pyruvate dehydrogenase (acetyl-transferring) E1 component subunit alpha [Halobacteriaceae archaeon]
MTATGRRDPGDRYQVLDEDGSVREGATPPDVGEGTLLEMYHDMRLARRLDERVVSLQRQGRIGTFPPLAGQEGAQVGSAHALADRDWILPSYREHAAMLARGFPLERYLLHWLGHPEGNRVPEDVNAFPIAIPVATQIPHATGAAWAAKLRGEDEVFCCYFGDGATSEGDFHEGLNFAGVFDVPAVFFCNNNQWAISTPRERQTASATLAQKADAYGFEGVQVDGMDPLAVYEVTRDAARKARDPDEGERRPTLIEAVQYRFGAHSTSDDPSVYRDADQVERWRERDPIPRLESYLRERGLLDDERVAAVEEAVETEIAEAVAAAEDVEVPAPGEMFAHVYADAPRRLEEQLAYLERLREEYGEGAFVQ